MQNRIRLMCSVLLVLSGGVVGCGDESPIEGQGGISGAGGKGGSNGNEAANCSQDVDCESAEVCHPTARICVKSCQTDADCPATAKKCDVIGVDIAGAGKQPSKATVKICQCADTSMCTQGSVGSSLVCSTYDKVCTVKCSSNNACVTELGRTCATATGQCNAPTCLPACSANQECKKQSDGALRCVDKNVDCSPACSGGQVCDKGATAGPTCVNACALGACGANVCSFDSGLCEAPKACISNNIQPAGCAYGQYCQNGVASDACAEVAAPTCIAVEFPDNHQAWGRGKSGPIIFAVKDTTVTLNDAATCDQNQAAKNSYSITVRLYSGAGDLPETISGVSANLYNNKSLISLPSNFKSYTRLPDNKTAEYTFKVCRSGTDAYTFGLRFELPDVGNEFCGTIAQ